MLVPHADQSIPAPGEPPQDPDFHRQRLLTELQIAVEAKRVVVRYKKSGWKAEFMRLVYPHCRAQSAKGFQDLIRRLTKGPWGEPNLDADPELKRLMRELEE